ncbi:helix-turn-helix domain-containing protein [Nocardia transvalensis]|uniref:helix-turn-helix domain-containing protein n=1 Tax=Nocardia transvalensis TaxID=37333 RepID=UPI001894C659|nr:helix-turn-helix transcriptional regulator [Nocardia transvalensis]MBF6328709.1 helix-turn-helix transcriptional regulator [Nocardia transvalensis]
MGTNERFKSLRLARGWTQAELAELVCQHVERTTGHRSAVDAQAISRIECGEVSWPRGATRQALVALLEVGSPDDLGLYPKRTQRDAEREEATKRRAFLALAGFSAAGLAETPRRVGTVDVEEMRQKFARLVGIDSYLGGADTFRTYYVELERTEQTLSRSCCSPAARRSLTELAAEQAQQSGWAAFDAGFKDKAIDLFKYSHRAAEEANSPELAANAYIHIAYASGTEDAVQAADSACLAIGLSAPPKARALLESRRAWSLAISGDCDGAARALDTARDALQNDDGTKAAWCAWVNHAELDIMTGRVWSVLHQPDKAIAPLRSALATYPDQWARDKALYLTWLADAYLDAGDDVEALSIAKKAFDLSVTIASARPLARVREVAQRCATMGIVGATDFARRTGSACAPIPARL